MCERLHICACPYRVELTKGKHRPARSSWLLTAPLEPKVMSPDRASARCRRNRHNRRKGGSVDPYFHDAFISYAHEDKPFAVLLERTLRRYTPSRGLPVPKRRLNIFRDETDLVGSEVLSAIAPHLEGSRKLIVICSPKARASKFVNEEIKHFTQVHSAKRDLISVIIAGVPRRPIRPTTRIWRSRPRSANALNTRWRATIETLIRVVQAPLTSGTTA